MQMYSNQSDTPLLAAHTQKDTSLVRSQRPLQWWPCIQRRMNNHRTSCVMRPEACFHQLRSSVDAKAHYLGGTIVFYRTFCLPWGDCSPPRVVNLGLHGVIYLKRWRHVWAISPKEGENASVARYPSRVVHPSKGNGTHASPESSYPPRSLRMHYPTLGYRMALD